MENLSQKRKQIIKHSQNRRINLIDISNKLVVFQDEDITSRSKLDYSDSEYLESGIISRAQTPSQKSPILQNETEVVHLSRVTESDNFSEMSLRSNCIFRSDKILTNASSFNHEAESTIINNKSTKNNLFLKFLPAIGCVPTSIYCWNCRVYIHTRLDFESRSFQLTLARFIMEVFSFCNMPEWVAKEIVHKCTKCGNILAKGRVT